MQDSLVSQARLKRRKWASLLSQAAATQCETHVLLLDSAFFPLGAPTPGAFRSASHPAVPFLLPTEVLSFASFSFSCYRLLDYFPSEFAVLSYLRLPSPSAAADHMRGNELSHSDEDWSTEDLLSDLYFGSIFHDNGTSGIFVCLSFWLPLDGEQFLHTYGFNPFFSLMDPIHWRKDHDSSYHYQHPNQIYLVFPNYFFFSISNQFLNNRTKFHPLTLFCKLYLVATIGYKLIMHQCC